MADSVLKLKVDDKEYNASLKNAKTGMQALEASLQKAGKTFNDCDKKVVEYVRAIGNMETQSKSARGRIGEMSTAFVELSQQYNKMTKDVQQSDVGKALSESMTTLRQRTIEAKQELAKLESQLREVNNTGMNLPDMTGGGGGLFSGGKLDGMLQVFGGNLMTKAAGAVASLGQEMYGMVQQGIELAKQGEGIRIAFERLGRGDILDGLRQATHGTVTDLELMKAAVKFDDFNLPVEQLGTLLAFAQKKAKDTGQSVDYMVDSIVTGLGRKSLMILDNLGLSAAQIKEEMAKTGDMTSAVANIIKEQMSQAGDYVETAADRAARAAADAANQMEDLGRKAMPVAEQWSQTWNTIKMGALDLLNNAVTPLINALTEAGRLRVAQQERGSSGRIAQQISWLQNPGEEGRQKVYERITDSYVDEINHARSEYNKLQKSAVWNPFAAWKADKALAALNVLKQEYADFKAQAAPVMNPKNEVVVKTENAQRDVDSLKQKLRELQTEYRAAIKAGDTGKSNDLLKQINQTKKDIKGLNPTALKTTSSHTTKEEKDDFIEIIGLIPNAEEAVKSLQQQIRDSWDEGEIARLTKDLQAAEKELERLRNIGKEVKPAEMVQGLSGFNAQTMGAWMQGRQGDLSKAEYGSAAYENIMANIADMNTIKTVLEESMKAGIDAAQFDLEPLWEKVFDGENIDDSVWQSMVDTINEKLKEMELDPIKIDFKTGSVKNEAKKMTDDWKDAASAIQSVGSAMMAIEDPAAKVMGTIAQAVASIALGAGQAIAQAGNGSAGGPWGWIAFAAAATATMVSTIAAIHSATGYANGGIVDGRGGGFVGGTAYSGDQVGNVRLDSGELVLNRAQQGNLASQLEGGGMQNLRLSTELDGRILRIVLNNDSQSRGRGKYVTSTSHFG